MRRKISSQNRPMRIPYCPSSMNIFAHRHGIHNFHIFTALEHPRAWTPRNPRSPDAYNDITTRAVTVAPPKPRPHISAQQHVDRRSTLPRPRQGARCKSLEVSCGLFGFIRAAANATAPCSGAARATIIHRFRPERRSRVVESMGFGAYGLRKNGGADPDQQSADQSWAGVACRCALDSEGGCGKLWDDGRGGQIGLSWGQWGAGVVCHSQKPNLVGHFLGPLAHLFGDLGFLSSSGVRCFLFMPSRRHGRLVVG